MYDGLYKRKLRQLFQENLRQLVLKLAYQQIGVRYYMRWMLELCYLFSYYYLMDNDLKTLALYLRSLLNGKFCSSGAFLHRKNLPKYVWVLDEVSGDS